MAWLRVTGEVGLKGALWSGEAGDVGEHGSLSNKLPLTLSILIGYNIIYINVWELIQILRSNITENHRHLIIKNECFKHFFIYLTTVWKGIIK